LTLPILIAGVLVVAILAALAFLRARETNARDAAWQTLATKTPWQAPPFEPSMLDGLPEAARHYLAAAIRPGAPLLPTVQPELRGQVVSLPGGGRQAMRGYEMLSPPFGSVLRLHPERGTAGLSGAVIFDDAVRARFWRFGLLPAGRGEPDIAQAAARLLVETLLWSPAALLPGGKAHWREAGNDAARVSMDIAGEQHEAEIETDSDGRLRVIRAVSPAGEVLVTAAPSDYREFDGYFLPARVVFDCHAPQGAPGFLEARVERVRFIGPWAGSRRS
jgi:hypothetical protein